MYLTRFTINNNRIALGWISNPYRVHQRLLMAYSGEPRLLFRIEENAHSTFILVQSEGVPDWKKAFTDFDVLLTEPELKNFDIVLRPDTLYRFRLLANPTVKRNKKRFGLKKEEDQRSWLERQMVKSGADLLGCQVRDNGMQKCSRNPVKDERTQTHFSVLFDGVIQARDPALLTQAVRYGVGPAKGYGFGLLSLGLFIGASIEKT